MKGTKLFIQVLLLGTLFSLSKLLVLNGGDLSSISAGDLTDYRPYLVVFLVSIARIMWRFRDTHTERKKVLLHNWHGLKINFKKWWYPQFKIHKTDYTLESVFELNGWLYIGIAAFGLSTSIVWHYIFTIAAALLTVILVIKSIPKDDRYRSWYFIGLGIGILAWIIGFTTKIVTITFGEFVFLITPMIWVIRETENVE